jgi:hypothetical protein
MTLSSCDLKGTFLPVSVSEGSIEVTGRRGRVRKQLLDCLKETRGCCKLEKEALEHTVWRTRIGRSYGPSQ